MAIRDQRVEIGFSIKTPVDVNHLSSNISSWGNTPAKVIVVNQDPQPSRVRHQEQR